MPSSAGPQPRSFTTSWVDLDGPTHLCDFGGETGRGPTFVLVHGLGGSHLDWTLLAPLLTRHGRVLALDLPAHGLTPTCGRSAAVRDDVRLLSLFVERHLTGPVVLVGNSRGGLVSGLTAPRVREQVVGVVLVDPALPAFGIRPDTEALLEVFPAALPFVGTRVVGTARRTMTVDRQVDRMVRYCFADPSRAPAPYLRAVASMLRDREPDAERDAASARAARTTVQWLLRPVAYDRALRRVRQPVLLVHGDRDRLVPISAARRALRRHPEWRAVVLEGVGHTPQLEAPDAVAEAIDGWLAGAGMAAR